MLLRSEGNSNERRQRGVITLSVPLCGALQAVYLTAVDDGLQLQGGQQPTVDGFLGDGQGVRDVRRRDAGERVGFHHDVRVRNSYCGWRGGERRERLFAATLVDDANRAAFYFETDQSLDVRPLRLHFEGLYSAYVSTCPSSSVSSSSASSSSSGGGCVL